MNRQLSMEREEPLVKDIAAPLQGELMLSKLQQRNDAIEGKEIVSV